MSEDAPYILATSCAEPDREFASLTQLARAVVHARDAMEGRPELVLTPSNVSRGQLPGGACVAVRARKDGDEGRGDFIAYALIPGAYADAAVRLLMTAILAVAYPEPA